MWSCGTGLPPNSKFCNECGAPIAVAGTHAEYKQVTVLFADVVHSMDIAAAVGAERMREIMAELADRCAAVVQRYGSAVDTVDGRRDHGGVRRACGVGGPRRSGLSGRLGRAGGGRRGLPSLSASATVWICGCGSG